MGLTQLPRTFGARQIAGGNLHSSVGYVVGLCTVGAGCINIFVKPE